MGMSVRRRRRAGFVHALFFVVWVVGCLGVLSGAAVSLAASWGRLCLVVRVFVG